MIFENILWFLWFSLTGIWLDEVPMKEEGELTIGLDDDPLVTGTEPEVTEFCDTPGKVLDGTGSDIDPISDSPQVASSSAATKLVLMTNVAHLVNMIEAMLFVENFSIDFKYF